MDIRQIKKYLMSKVGSQIVVVYYGGRNRKERYQGYLWKIYNNVFTIRLFNGDVKTFSYIDILTKTIHIFI